MEFRAFVAIAIRPLLLLVGAVTGLAADVTSTGAKGDGQPTIGMQFNAPSLPGAA